MLVTLPSPILKLQTRPSIRNVLQAKERALIPCSSIVFNLDSHLSPLRNLGAHQKLCLLLLPCLFVASVGVMVVNLMLH
jgi:hypothetical protein